MAGLVLFLSVGSAERSRSQDGRYEKAGRRGIPAGRLLRRKRPPARNDVARVRQSGEQGKGVD